MSTPNEKKKIMQKRVFSYTLILYNPRLYLWNFLGLFIWVFPFYSEYSTFFPPFLYVRTRLAGCSHLWASSTLSTTTFTLFLRGCFVIFLFLFFIFVLSYPIECVPPCSSFTLLCGPIRMLRYNSVFPYSLCDYRCFFQFIFLVALHFELATASDLFTSCPSFTAIVFLFACFSTFNLSASLLVIIIASVACFL